MNFKDSDMILTSRLILRKFKRSDADAVARFCDNLNIYKNTLYLPYPYTINDALTWIDSHEANFEADRSYEFAIVDRNSNELYGAIGLSYNPRHAQGEIAYWVGEDYWGNGYATEAARAVLDFAFNVKKMHKVFARFFATNQASGAVLEKLGMIKEGTLIDHIKKDNQFHTMIYYGLLNPK